MINSPLEQFHLLKYIRLFLMGCCIQFFMKELPLYMNIEWLKLTLFFESIFLIILVVILLNSFFAISLVKITLFSCEKIFLTSFFNITTLLLAFNSFRHIHYAFRYNGIEGLMEFFWEPTFVFQLNLIVWSVYLSVVVLAYAAVKRYPDQIYSIVSRDRLKTAGLNPNLSSHFKKFLICVGIGAGSAVAVDLGESALRTSTEHQAISANQQAVDQAHQNLHQGHITGSDFKSIAESSINSNREIATTHTKRGNTLKTFFETLFGKKN